MGNYKLIALDMDGTVLDEHSRIPERNRQAMLAAMKAGVSVMFATGRGMQSVRPFIDELGWSGPVVTVNGGEVWQDPQTLMKRELLEPEEVRRLRQLAIQHQTWYWAYAVEGLYNSDHWADDEHQLSWLKFGFSENNAAVLEKIKAELASWETLELTNSHPTNLEINPKGVNKAAGIRRVCRLLGLDMSDVLAIGDSLNDLAMIRDAGLGIAMGNAQDFLKQEADAVTLSNKECGVAEAIQRYVLNAL